MNVTDFATGIKIGSYIHPAWPPQQRKLMSWTQIQANLRDAFTRWGLPDRFRTDQDHRLVAPGQNPVPMFFPLWLTGLGIQPPQQIIVVTFSAQTRPFEVRLVESDEVLLSFRPDWLSVCLLGRSKRGKLLTVHLVRLGDGPPWALRVQALLGPLIQTFTDETSLLRVGQKGNEALVYIIQ